jgi:hypothetical protein
VLALVDSGSIPHENGIFTGLVGVRGFVGS